MATDELKGNLLRQAVAEYSTGTKNKKELSLKTKKSRRLFGDCLTNFFNDNGWIFNEHSAEAWIESKKRYDKKGKLKTKKSSIAAYVAQIRAFNKFCIDRKYLTVHFCEWIAKPSESETLKPIPDIAHDVLLQAIQLGTIPNKGDRKRSKKIKKEGRAALEFMLFTSRRSGEMAALKGYDINVNASEPIYSVIVKGGKFLDFPIPENLILMMKKRQHKEYAFEVSPTTTIKYLRDGLRKLGIAEKIIELVDNHTLRKAFAKERYRNGDSVDEIADAMNDTVHVVKKYYLARDIKKMRETVNNTFEAKGGIDIKTIYNEISKNVAIQVSDPRFIVAEDNISENDKEIAYTLKIIATK